MMWNSRTGSLALTTTTALLLSCFLLVAGQDSDVAAARGRTMELSAPFLANSPASDLNGTGGNSIQITEVTRDPSPQPPSGQDLPITATISGNPSGVNLIYRINYGPEKSIPMDSGDSSVFTAAIPSADFKAGDMVRWKVAAGPSISPAITGADQYFGTAIADPSVNFNIPVMEWFTDDISKSTTKQGHNGSSVYFLGRFYDNLFVRRKGVTSLSWPKPKLKFKLHDNEFIYKPNLSKANREKKVDEFDLTSMYYEPGQKSYMREAIAYQVLQDVGAVSATSFHLVLRCNGEFYGLYAYTENDDKYYLERNGLNPDGLLVKPTGGAPGLSPFFSQSQLMYYFKQQNQKKKQSAWAPLFQFLQGVAGNGNSPRSTWVFDNIELSGLFGYDLKSAMNTAAGFGGTQASDYCTLTCPQWNSPLYCDRAHPQDVSQNSTNPWNAIQPGSIGKKLLQAAPSPSTSIPDNGPQGVNVNITNPDANLVSQGLQGQGAALTFNFLIDLITQVPDTRQMYLRRLRTLTDYYYPTGRLAGMITDMYNLIKPAADIDNQKWNIGPIDLGYKQLVQEQIPARQAQLLTMYGPGGSQPLLPDAQPASPALKLGRVDLTSSSEQRFVEITNPLKYAVDVSNWKLSGAVTATIKPGTVIAAGNSLIVASDSAGFRQRNTSPKLGEGFQVIGKLSGGFVTSQPIQLDTGAGANIDSTPGGGLPSAAG